jgi:hypothetical protein
VFTLRASLDLSTVPDLAAALPWRLNIAAVTEDLSGEHAWWALSHPSEAPDFHHPDAFTRVLPFSHSDPAPGETRGMRVCQTSLPWRPANPMSDPSTSADGHGIMRTVQVQTLTIRTHGQTHEIRP